MLDGFHFISKQLFLNNWKVTINKKQYTRRNILHLWGSKTRIKVFISVKKKKGVRVCTCAM